MEQATNNTVIRWVIMRGDFSPILLKNYFEVIVDQSAWPIDSKFSLQVVL